MSLTASMWTGVSGLLTHGEKMNVVGNNIANVSTLGFKSQRMDFQDFIYASSYSASGATQVGRGVSVEAIFGDFSQGSFDTTGTVTDLAIGGNGFFKVVSPLTNQEYYTRAGNFRFTNDGYLREPHGYTLQGWAIDNSQSGLSVGGVGGTTSTTTSAYKGTGLPTDVHLHGFTVEPKRTDTINISAVLTSDVGYDKTTSATSPYTALFDTWDGTAEPPLSEDAYAYAVPFNVYDEAGTAHQLTVYYDQVRDPDEANNILLQNLPAGYSVYEYVVTMKPGEDMRTYTDGVTDGLKVKDTEAAGLLMTGTMIFSPSGQLVSQSAYTWMGQDNIPEGDYPLDPTVKANWKPTAVSNQGYPVFVANFTGVGGANTVNDGTSTAAGSRPTGNQYIIQFDMGLSNTNATVPWTNTNTLATVGLDYDSLALMSAPVRHSDSVVSWSGSSSTEYVRKNGYSFGDLLSVSVDQDGILYATYTNSVTLPLYQIALYDFVNKDGLYREGGNLFSATMASGDPSVAPANVSGMGSVNAYSVEQSNVDLAKEFVNMITTQRGFQANSKVVTTTDTMLETVISMKR